MRGLVAAGAEGFVAGAGQHDARDLAIVGGNVEGLDQLFQSLPTEGIVDLRPIDDDPGGAVADFVDDVGELGRV